SDGSFVHLDTHSTQAVKNAVPEAMDEAQGFGSLFRLMEDCRHRLLETAALVLDGIAELEIDFPFDFQTQDVAIVWFGCEMASLLVDNGDRLAKLIGNFFVQV